MNIDFATLATWATLVGSAFTLIALGLASYQVRQAKGQSRRLQAHEERLGDVAASLSTRYLGPFPDYLPTAIEIIKGATREILVMRCNPTPAYFSHPLLWNAYNGALDERIHSGVEVTVVCGNRRGRLLRTYDQFEHTEEDWEEWRSSNHEKLEDFLARQCPGARVEEVTTEEFLKALVKTQDRLIHELFGTCKRLEVQATMALEAWIVDSREAVFTIQSTHEHGVSHGLYTSDPGFVLALASVRAIYSTESRSEDEAMQRWVSFLSTEPTLTPQPGGEQMVKANKDALVAEGVAAAEQLMKTKLGMDFPEASAFDRSVLDSCLLEAIATTIVNNHGKILPYSERVSVEDGCDRLEFLSTTYTVRVLREKDEGAIEVRFDPNPDQRLDIHDIVVDLPLAECGHTSGLHLFPPRSERIMFEFHTYLILELVQGVLRFGESFG